MTADVSDGLTTGTLRGAEVFFSLFDGMVMINDLEIIAADIKASNDVIHVIDFIILPPAEKKEQNTIKGDLPRLVFNHYSKKMLIAKIHLFAR